MRQKTVLTKTAMALRELYSTFKRQAAQHLFCYKQFRNYHKAQRPSENSEMNTVGNYHGEMYKAPIDAPSRYDWKQLGLLA